jgi:hypothetical protein
MSIMMKSLTGLLKLTVLLIVTVPLLSAGGCGDNENVGYHYISIPGFTIDDYYGMLGNSNEEIQYNAICNLWYQANVEILEKDSLKGTPEYNKTLKIYEKIYPMMDSKNTWVSSAAIRFVSRCKYNGKAFLEQSLRNNSPSVNVQLSIWSAWDRKNEEVKVDSSLLIQKINFCFKHPSWLIQQCAYDYINPATVRYFENDLIAAYSKANEMYRRLQVIHVLDMNVSDSIFNFIAGEYRVTQDSVLQKNLLLSLTKALNKQQAYNWFIQHKKETAVVLQTGVDFTGEENDFYPQLVLIALRQGWDPANVLYSTDEDKQFPLLYYWLFESKYHYEFIRAHPGTVPPKQPEKFKLIEDQLLSDEKMRQGWLNYEQANLTYPLPADLVKEHQRLTARYAEDVKNLLNRYKVDSSTTKTFLTQLNNNANDLYRVRIKK